MTDWTDTPCSAYIADGIDLWYPATGDSAQDSQARVAEAKAVCAGCPLKAACAEAGKGEEWGIWGGLTASDRLPQACGELRGTPAGASRHHKVGQKACDECRDAKRDRDRERRALGAKKGPAGCGTIRGASAHRRSREPLCDLCREADVTPCDGCPFKACLPCGWKWPPDEREEE